MSAIFVWWIGAGAAEAPLLDGVRERLEAAYETPARTYTSAARPEGTFDPRRGQHSSSRTLAWLVAYRPHDATRVVGVTDADLFIPVLTFVFGEAQLNGKAAVVSTARLSVNDNLPPDPRRLYQRLSKECVHELGHTFGLLHCKNPRCAMARSSSLLDVDAKAPALCADCRSRYRELRME